MAGEWRARPFAGWDTETTGVDVETCAIVTCCFGLASPTGWQSTNWLIQQDAPIPAEATAVHGITTEHANEHGQPAREALPQIRDALYRAWSEGMPVAAYNACYDFTVLDRNLRRHGLGALEIRGPVLDPHVLDKDADPYRRGSRKLIDVAAHYGIVLTEAEAHGAEADALTAARLAWKLGASVVSLQAAHDLQVAAYRKQRESFAAYLAKKGDRLDDDNRVWPLKPYPDAGTLRPAA